MKAKEYLLKQGKITDITRGRISKDNHEFLKHAVSKGASIEGYSVSTARVGNVEPVVSKVALSNEKVVSELMPYRYTEEAYQAYQFIDGKKVTRSLREACRGCGYSLVVCYCVEPRIVALDGSSSVRIYVERK